MNQGPTISPISTPVIPSTSKDYDASVTGPLHTDTQNKPSLELVDNKMALEIERLKIVEENIKNAKSLTGIAFYLAREFSRTGGALYTLSEDGKRTEPKADIAVHIKFLNELEALLGVGCVTTKENILKADEILIRNPATFTRSLGVRKAVNDIRNSIAPKYLSNGDIVEVKKNELESNDKFSDLDGLLDIISLARNRIILDKLKLDLNSSLRDSFSEDDMKALNFLIDKKNKSFEVLN